MSKLLAHIVCVYDRQLFNRKVGRHLWKHIYNLFQIFHIYHYNNNEFTFWNIYIAVNVIFIKTVYL